MPRGWHRWTPVVDAIRGLHAQFGTRPYQVWKVKTRWSGGVRGEGTETVVSATEIVPTPRVGGVESLDEILSPSGRCEQGQLELSEVSLSYAESDLTWATDGYTVPADEEWFYEVRFNNGMRRRFYPVGAPERDASRTFGWRVRLTRQHADRDTQGVPYR